MKISEEVGSKYRFIILAGQRVAQLQKGARPRVDDVIDEKFTTIATQELSEGLLTFRKLADKPQYDEALLNTFVPPIDVRPDSPFLNMDEPDEDELDEDLAMDEEDEDETRESALIDDDEDLDDDDEDLDDDDDDDDDDL